MILSRRVALGGTQLDSLHNRIVIRSIDPGVPRETIQAANRMGGSGQRITGAHWETLEVGVNFAIDVPKSNLQLRRTVFDTVMAWAAAKGWLTVNWMPTRRMYVDKVIFPASGDMWAWTDEYTLAFRAYNVPFWQNSTATTASASSTTSGTLSIQVGGDVQSVLDATFKNTSGSTINTFSITAGGHQISLSSLGLANGSTLQISHGTDGLLRLYIGTTSVYAKYTGADDLYVNPGTVSVAYSAGGAGTLTLSNYGRWV